MVKPFLRPVKILLAFSMHSRNLFLQIFRFKKTFFSVDSFSLIYPSTMWIAHTEDTSSGRSCEWMTGLRSIHHRKITLVFTDLHGLHIQVYPVPCKCLQKHWLDEVIWSKVILVPESSAGTRVRKMGKCLTHHLLDTGASSQNQLMYNSPHTSALLFFIWHFSVFPWIWWTILTLFSSNWSSK